MEKLTAQKVGKKNMLGVLQIAQPDCHHSSTSEVPGCIAGVFASATALALFRFTLAFVHCTLHDARNFIDYLSLSRNSDAQRRDAHLERFMCAHFEESEYILFRGIKVFCSPAELHI